MRSNLKGGVTGHLFLVVSDTDCQQATSGTLNKPNDPNKPTPIGRTRRYIGRMKLYFLWIDIKTYKNMSE